MTFRTLCSVALAAALMLSSCASSDSEEALTPRARWTDAEASALGFNTMHVFLHDLLWDQDPEAFLGRIDQFLAVADRNGIAVMLVFFDGV